MILKYNFPIYIYTYTVYMPHGKIKTNTDRMLYQIGWKQIKRHNRCHDKSTGSQRKSKLFILKCR